MEKMPEWVRPSDIDDAIAAFSRYDAKRLSLHNWRTMIVAMKVLRQYVEKINDGWYFVPPEPTDEMIRAYMFERAKGQYPHEDAGGGVVRKIRALFTGEKSPANRTYHQMIDAAQKGKTK